MNKILLTGNLTKDPELKFSKEKGLPFATATLAVNDGIKDTTYFIPFVIFNKTAEVFTAYAKKGSKIGISGRLSLTSFKKEDGSYYNEAKVLAETFEFINYRKKNNEETVSSIDDVDMSVETDEALPF